MLAALRVIEKFLLQVGLMLFWIFPVQKKKILFINGLNNGYADNPKYMCEYLLQHRGAEYQYWYVTGDPAVAAKLEKRGVHTVPPGSCRFVYHALTCGVLLTNAGGFSYLPIRRKQYVINMWHGGGAYKKMGLDQRGRKFWNVLDCKINANKTDCFVSSASITSQVLQSGLCIRPETLYEIGMPRNDIFFQPTDEIRRKALQKLGFSEDEKYLLYAPTFRNAGDNVLLKKNSLLGNIDVPQLTAALEKRFGGKWNVLVKLHPGVQKEGNILPTGTADVSSYDDMQELLCLADVLLNDYSSSMWDFSLLKKPCFLLAEDYEHYRKTIGLYLDWKKLPFPFAETFEECIQNILGFQEDVYQEKLKEHLLEMGSFENGTACQRLAIKIDERIRGDQQ